MGRHRFSVADRRAMHKAVAAAEDLVAGFYCIPGREWPRYPYDLQTLADGPGPRSPAFADVIRACSRGGGSRTGSRDLYRIRLRDDGILAAVHDRDDGIELYPLLLYVMTHELVHVVRFGSGFAAYEAPKPARSDEEGRVHRITRRILRPVAEASLQRVLDVYRREPDDLALTDCAPPR